MKLRPLRSLQSALSLFLFICLLNEDYGSSSTTQWCKYLGKNLRVKVAQMARRGPARRRTVSGIKWAAVFTHFLCQKCTEMYTTKYCVTFKVFTANLG